MFKVNNKDTKTMPLPANIYLFKIYEILKPMFNLSTYFTPFAYVSTVDFKQVIASTFPQPY